MPHLRTSKHVFTYGSLMFDEVWAQVVDGKYRCAPATIFGYARKGVKGEHYPALVPAGQGATVRGRVYFSVSPADIERLDHFEGPQYRRRPCQAILDLADQGEARSKIMVADEQVHSRHASDGAIAVSCYLWRDSLRHMLQANDWDEAMFRRKGLQQFIRKYRGFAR